MEGRGASVEDLLNEFGKSSTGSPLLGKGLDLLLGGDFAGDEEPEETFGKGLGTAGGLREKLLALGNGLAAETDTLLCEE